MEHSVSGVGVIDKSMTVFDVVVEHGASSLAEIVLRTGLSKATAHRLAVALEAHGLFRRDEVNRFALGLRLVDLGRRSAAALPLSAVARGPLERLRDVTGESAQLYVREGEHRRCLVSLDSHHELRTIVSAGARLPLGVGSAGRVLVDEAPEGVATASRGERAPGVGSISAPVVHRGAVVAAVGVSGPLGRLGEDLLDRFGPSVVEAAGEIAAALG